MSETNGCPKTSSDEIALKKKDAEEKQPLIAPNLNRLENVCPYSTSGDEADNEDDNSSGSDLFEFAKSQVLLVFVSALLLKTFNNELILYSFF